MTDIETVLQDIESWDDIAEGFRQRGVRGFRNNACDCPVANYVKEQSGDTTFVVSPVSYSAERTNGYTPTRVGQFIGRFDARYYPDLEMTHEEVGAFV